MYLWQDFGSNAQAPKLIARFLSGHSICGSGLKKVSLKYYISYLSAACIANCMTINFKDILTHTHKLTMPICVPKKKNDLRLKV